MLEPIGTVYLRDNVWFANENLYKMGITKCPVSRACTYITSEPIPGEYSYIIEIHLAVMHELDKRLKEHFSAININAGGGTEFYDRTIINLLEPFFITAGIWYKILTKEEISQINRRARILKIAGGVQKAMVFDRLKDLCIARIIPKAHQQDILNMIESYYEINDAGKLIWACGLGKALMALLIVRKMRYSKICIGVPSRSLQEQFAKEILRLFPGNKIMLLPGDEDIMAFLNDTKSPKFIITTYHSCHMLINPDIIFDFKIGDEAHHLSREDCTLFSAFHKIKSIKSLFMTATEKTNMANKALYGSYIDIKTVHWAIENKKITDYNVLILKNTAYDVSIISQKYKLCASDLFMACYMSVMSLIKYDITHILLYTNTTEEADMAQKYIELIKNDSSMYNKSLHSKNCRKLDVELCLFKAAPRGIISCAFLLGEGIDLPELNAVCIAGAMYSEIRIIQYLLRPNRLIRERPDKIAYIILPYIESNDLTKPNESYDKVRNIIYHMRNVDAMIEQKMIMGIIQNKIIAYKADDIIVTVNVKDQELIMPIDESVEELDKFKLRLRYSKALHSWCSEDEDIYNYMRELNISLGITSKSEFYEKNKLSDSYNEPYFIRVGVWTNWYHFMGHCINKYISGITEWRQFCYNIGITSLQEYQDACLGHECLPKEPADLYIGFTNIPLELGFNMRKRK